MLDSRLMAALFLRGRLHDYEDFAAVRKNRRALAGRGAEDQVRGRD